MPYPPREVSLLKKLRHPNICQLYDIITLHDRILLMTEYEKFNMHANSCVAGIALVESSSTTWKNLTTSPNLKPGNFIFFPCFFFFFSCFFFCFVLFGLVWFFFFSPSYLVMPNCRKTLVSPDDIRCGIYAP